MNAILRRKDVERITGLPRSTLYHKIDKGEFPKPIPLSARAVGWLESEINAWIKTRIQKRDQEAA
jgi:prophage regulatory protein